MYHHAKVFIYDKEILNQAIKTAFEKPLIGSVKIVIDNFGSESFLLTEQQLQQLEQEGITNIVCDRSQILNYAHSCLTKKNIQ